MKAQLQGQQLRIRIDEDELAALLDGRELIDITLVDDRFAMRRVLALAPGEAAGLTGDAASWRIVLPDGEVRALAGRLPSRDGLRFDLPAGGTSLQLLFDVDVRDSVRRRRS
jgi:hypothetical protein